MVLPVHAVTLPADLTDAVAKNLNGKLGDCNLTAITLAGIGHASLEKQAARAFQAMQVAVLGATGQTLSASSSVDCYRPYQVQLNAFVARYTPTFDPTVNIGTNYVRIWNGHTYYQKKGTVPCAVPGTSNHGWGLAVDVAVYNPALAHVVNVKNYPTVWQWLLTYADAFGFSWENPNEGVDDMHLHYWAGDNIQHGVLEIEAWLASGDHSTPPPIGSPIPAPSSPFGLWPTTANKRRLSLGASGADVGYLQQVLAKVGLYTLKIDQQFGPKTETAVRVFQGHYGLVVDGVVGNQTWPVVDKVALS